MPLGQQARFYAFHLKGLVVSRGGSRRRLSPKRFIIFGRGRSGSTALVSLLDAVPGLQCDGEVLHDWVPFPEAHVRARCALSGVPTYGCKILSYQIQDVQPLRRRDRVLHRFHDDGFTILYLARENLVAHALSNLRARELGFHHVAGDERRSDAASDAAARSVEIAVDDLLGWTRSSEALADYEAHLLDGVPHLPLSYERHLEDATQHQATVDEVCRWLGIPSAPVATALTKVSPPSLRASIANYDEVADALAGTPYARFLD